MTRCLAASMLVLCASGLVLAADNQAEVTLVYPCRPAPGPITVDGKLTDAEWNHAVEVSAFQVSGASTLAPQQTVLRVLYDKTHVYLAIKCGEPRVKHLVATTRQRDGSFWLDDAVEIFFDTNHDHDTHVQLAVTSRGTLFDALGSPTLGSDSTWNCPFRAAVHKGAYAWTMEAAVPVACLGKQPPSPGALWGFNVCRERRAGGKHQLHNWANVERRFNNAPMYGHLRFVGAGWKGTKATAASAADGVGGKQSTVFADAGVWRVQPGKPGHWRSYRSVASQLTASSNAYMDELRAAYKKRPKLAMHKEFARLEADHRKVRSLIAGAGPLGAEACAYAQTHIEKLGHEIELIYWRVRVVLLNESM